MLLKRKDVPLYLQIAAKLRAKIDGKEWEPGSKIPSEPELAKSFDVCRMTVRQALSELETDGVISRQRGRGTFVTQLHSFGSVITLRLPEGFGTQHSLTGVEKRAAGVEVAKRLGVEPKTKIVELRRVRYFSSSTEPAELETAFMTQKIFSLLRDEDLTRPICPPLRCKLNITADRCECQILPIALDAGQAELMQLPEGTLALRLDRVWLNGNEPLLFTTSVYLPEETRRALKKRPE